MNDLVKEDSMSTPKKKFSMSKEVKENELTKCVRVREISNGFIINYSKYGYEDSDTKKEHYISEEYEKYSKTNPLSDKSEKEEEDKIETMVDFFNPKIKD
jgi:hypothetical protein